jgi:hypothetical protein
MLGTVRKIAVPGNVAGSRRTVPGKGRTTLMPHAGRLGLKTGRLSDRRRRRVSVRYTLPSRKYNPPVDSVYLGSRVGAALC